MRTKTQEKAILLVTDPDKITPEELMRQASRRKPRDTWTLRLA